MILERNAALRRYVDLKAEVKELDTALKEKKAQLFNEMRNVHEILRKDGTTKSTTVDLGDGYGEVRFTPGETTRNNVYDKKSLIEWIRTNPEVDEGEYFWSDKLRDAALNDLIKEINEHQKGALPPGLEEIKTKKVTVTKVRKKRS